MIKMVIIIKFASEDAQKRYLRGYQNKASLLAKNVYSRSTLLQDQVAIHACFDVFSFF